MEVNLREIFHLELTNYDCTTSSLEYQQVANTMFTQMMRSSQSFAYKTGGP